MITSSYPRQAGDAAGHFVAAEVETLRDAGHDVIVWAAGSGSPTADPQVQFLGGSMLFDHPGAWPRLKAAPYRALGLIMATSTVLHRTRLKEAKRVDRIVAHWLFPSAVPWALIAAPRTTPLELVIHGSDLTLALGLPRWMMLRMLRLLASRPVKLRFVSQALKDALKNASLSRELEALIDAAVVLPSPISLPTVPSHADARRRLGLNLDARVSVIVGRLIPGKRIDVALTAASLVPGLHTTVIGSGPLEQELRQRFPSVQFLGQLGRNETLLWIRAADLLLSTSRHEGAPTAVREALELKTPVVAVESGDLVGWSKLHDELHVIVQNA